MAGTLTRVLLRIVATDTHEGPTYFADEDALYVTTARGPTGTSILRIALDGLRPVGPGRDRSPRGHARRERHDRRRRWRCPGPWG